MKLRQLFVKEIASIGAVDSGDNPESDIVFWKRKESDVIAEQTEGNSMEGFDLSALPEAAQEEFTQLRKQLEDAQAQIAELTPQEDLPEAEVIGKASDEVQALIAKQREDLEAAQTELAKARAAQRDAEFVKRVADDGLDVLLGKAEEIGPALRALADAAPDAFDSVYKNMHAAAQRVDLAGAFGEIGEDQGETDPVSKRDAWVMKMRKDGDTRSVATLRADFWETHPDERSALRESK